MKQHRHWSALTISGLLTFNLLSTFGTACAQEQKSDASQSAHGQFSLPQETAPSPTDNEKYSDFSYNGFAFGMSFQKWKQIQEDKGLLDNIKKVSKGADLGAATYKIAKPPLQVLGISWEPIFMFVENEGVYRLAMIEGSVPKTKAAQVLSKLTDENGKAEIEPATGAQVWTSKDGKTRTMSLAKEEDGSRSVAFYDIAIYGAWLRKMMSTMKN